MKTFLLGFFKDIAITVVAFVAIFAAGGFVEGFVTGSAETGSYLCETVWDIVTKTPVVPVTAIINLNPFKNKTAL